jgi:hypothetical protein
MPLSRQAKTELFMKRFNCSAHQITRMGKVVSHRVLSNFSVPGLQAANNYNPYWALDIASPLMHPISLMVSGKRRRSVMPAPDLEYYMGIRGSMDVFRQGFANIPNNKDCWTGYVDSQDGYWNSLYFNLGRAFLKKLFNISLPYTLPPTYQKLFQELK